MLIFLQSVVFVIFILFNDIFEVDHVQYHGTVHVYGIHSIPLIKHHGLIPSLPWCLFVTVCSFQRIPNWTSYWRMKEICNPCVSKSVQVHCLRHANTDGMGWAIFHTYMSKALLQSMLVWFNRMIMFQHVH